MKISKIKSFVFGLAFLGSMGFGGISANAQGLGGEGTLECKVEVISCGIFSSNYRQICHSNGDGLVCSQCGSSTVCP